MEQNEKLITKEIREDQLTDITPNRHTVIDIPSPNEAIHPIYNIDGKEPYYHGDSSNITRSPVPRQRNENESSGNEGEDGKLRVLHWYDK